LKLYIDFFCQSGLPDLLEKRSGVYKFGDWIYVPIDVKSSSEIKTLHKQQLAFYCMMLNSIQGYFPDVTSIINRNFEKLEVILDEKILLKIQEDIDEILAIFRGKRHPVHISSSTRKLLGIKNV